MEREIERLEDEIRILRSELKGRRELEEQLYQSQKMEALAALSGGIAHDFNNILHCIQGYTEWALLKKYKGSPDHELLNSTCQARGSFTPDGDLFADLGRG